MKVNQYKCISLLTSADLPHLWTVQGLAYRDCSRKCLPPCQAGFPRALLERHDKALRYEDFWATSLYAEFSHAHSQKKTLFSLVGRLLGKQWCNLFFTKLSGFWVKRLLSWPLPKTMKLLCVIAWWQWSQSRVPRRPDHCRLECLWGSWAAQGLESPVGAQQMWLRDSTPGTAELVGKRKWQPVQAPAVLGHKCSQSCVDILIRMSFSFESAGCRFYVTCLPLLTGCDP